MMRLGLLIFALLGFSPIARSEDDRPVVDDRNTPAEQAANRSLPTLWIAGDSTVKCGFPMRGWGQELPAFFDPAKINIVNRAIGGRSSRTYTTEGRWQQLLESVRPGDFVLIQFGHNDVGPLDEKGKFRGSLPGTGHETQTITRPDGSSEVVQTFGSYLRQFVKSAKAKRTIVFLCSPIPHLRYSTEGKFVHDWTKQRTWIETVAKEEGATFIDLAELVAKTYDSMPRSDVEKLFADKGTHTNTAGATLNAQVLAQTFRQPKSPLAPFLRPQP